MAAWCTYILYCQHTNWSSRFLAFSELLATAVQCNSNDFLLKLKPRSAHFIHSANFSRDEAYLKVPNHFCTACLLENGSAAVFRPFPNIQHYLLLGCNPGSQASAKWEWVINQWTSSTYKKHPQRALTSEANPYLIVPVFSCRWREVGGE